MPTLLPRLAAIAGLILLAACTRPDDTPDATPSLTVSVATPQRDSVVHDVVASGAVAAWEEVSVGVELSGGRLDETTDGGWRYPKATYKAVGANARMNFGESPWFMMVRGGYFDAEQDIPGGGDFSTDGGYAGLAVGVDLNRHFNITLGYTGFVYADEYYDSDCDDDYTYDCDFNRADTVTLGVEARF